MKNNPFVFTITIVFLFTFLSLSSFSQWTNISTNPGYLFTRVFAQNKDTVFVVGDSGLLLKTINGGGTWNKINLPTNKRLFDIGFVNSLTGYLSGAGGLVLKTVDNGNTWTNCTTNTTLNLRCLTILNENTAWFGGSSSNDQMIFSADSGIIIRTTNGGNSFTKQYQPLMAVQDICCFNADTCLALCNNSVKSSIRIMRTVNSGISWQVVNDIGGEHPLTSLVIFPTGESITASGFGGLIQSMDYGSSWNNKPGFFLEAVIELSFPSPNTGYSAGWENFNFTGGIEKTKDDEIVGLFSKMVTFRVLLL